MIDNFVSLGNVVNNGSLKVGGDLNCTEVSILSPGDEVGRFGCKKLERNFGKLNSITTESTVDENFGKIFINLGSVLYNKGFIGQSFGKIVSNDAEGFIAEVATGSSLTSNHGKIGILGEGVQLVANFGTIFENRGSIVMNQGIVANTTNTGIIMNNFNN